MATPAPKSRLAFIELLRAFGSQLIVWHHLVFYGPLSDFAYPLAPGLFDWLYDYARMAVQVFLVVGGFLAARSFAKDGEMDPGRAWALVKQRYKRIGGPYLVTLAVAVAANALADRYMDHESISAPPTVPQLVAHAFFLHDLLGFEALSAGIWYLAIDFQLVLLTLAIALVSGPLSRLTKLSRFGAMQLLVWPLAALSMFWANRHGELEDWAIYFFASYSLGLVVQWALARKLPAWAFAAYALALVAAVGLDFRPRLVVSLAIGAAIFAGGKLGFLDGFPQSRVVAYLGRISYVLFLIHFPVCLVVNALLWKVSEHSPFGALGGMVLAWGLSMVAAVLFHHGIEARLLREPARPRVPEPAQG